MKSKWLPMNGVDSIGLVAPSDYLKIKCINLWFQTSDFRQFDSSANHLTTKQLFKIIVEITDMP